MISHMYEKNKQDVKMGKINEGRAQCMHSRYSDCELRWTTNQFLPGYFQQACGKNSNIQNIPSLNCCHVMRSVALPVQTPVIDSIKEGEADFLPLPLSSPKLSFTGP
jgi:hypothetical protein